MVEVPGCILPDRAAPRLERRRISPEGGGSRQGGQRAAAWGRIPPGRAESRGLGADPARKRQILPGRADLCWQ
jgi:hypothetical protein